MKRAFFLLILIFLSGCQSPNKHECLVNTVESQSNTLFSDPDEDQKLVNEIRRKVAIELRKEKELFVCGIGSQMMNKIKMLALSFNYYKPIEIEEGRQLLIAAVEKFVTIVNTEKRIHPYLNNYPFEAKNIEIRIFLRNPNDSDVPAGQLSVIVALEGILEYEIDDPKTSFLKTIHKETYEEALLKVNTALAKRT